MRFKRALPLIFLVIAALALRVAGIKLGLPSETGGLATLHGDESMTFHSLGNMNPSKLDFYPGDTISWGTFHVYSIGALIKTLDLAGVIELGDRQKLQDNLGEVDKMYLAARAFSALFGVLSIVALYFIGCLFLSERAALFSAILMAFSLAPVMISYLVKPDTTMLFWGLISVYFSFKLLREPSTANYFLAGSFLGLAFITKLSAALLGFFPFAAHFYHVYAARNPFFGFKKFSILTVSGLAVYLILNPYLILRFSDELKWMSIVFSCGSVGANSGGSLLEVYAAYFLSVLPAAFGWALVPFALAAVARWFRGPSYEKKISAVYCALFIAWSGATPFTNVHYALLVAPFLFLAAGDLAHRLFNKRWGKLLVIAVFAQVLLYTLYIKRNYVSSYTTKEADTWIRENVPEGSTIAISRNDFWMPRVIRRRSGSFKLLEGGAPQGMLPQAIVELGNIYSKADYVIISEYEYAGLQSAPKEFPAENAALEKIFSGTKEVKRFEHRLPLYILPFQSKSHGYQPAAGLQVNFMNPGMLVLKVIPPPGQAAKAASSAGGRPGGGIIKK